METATYVYKGTPYELPKEVKLELKSKGTTVIKSYPTNLLLHFDTLANMLADIPLEQLFEIIPLDIEEDNFSWFMKFVDIHEVQKKPYTTDENEKNKDPKSTENITPEDNELLIEAGFFQPSEEQLVQWKKVLKPVFQEVRNLEAELNQKFLKENPDATVEQMKKWQEEIDAKKEKKKEEEKKGTEEKKKEKNKLELWREELKEILETFFQSKNPHRYHRLDVLLRDAKYLDNDAAVKLLLKTFANLVKGKTPMEIRATFWIYKDFTDEEYKALKEQYKWNPKDQ